tara:strand:- start:868 stop:1164 length:297 start_codon:yes stop_codon:yes gene_type:complete
MASFPKDMRRIVLEKSVVSELVPTPTSKPKKPMYIYKLEQRLNKQEVRIRLLEEQIEASQEENKRLKDQLAIGVPIELLDEQGRSRTNSETTIFKVSL